MRRRTMVRRIGVATAGVTGLATTGSAGEPTHVNWELDGRMETIPVAAFERRADTPSVSELSDDMECCCCGHSGACTFCRVCCCPDTGCA